MRVSPHTHLPTPISPHTHLLTLPHHSDVRGRDSSENSQVLPPVCQLPWPHVHIPYTVTYPQAKLQRQARDSKQVLYTQTRHSSQIIHRSANTRPRALTHACTHTHTHTHTHTQTHTHTNTHKHARTCTHIHKRS